MRRIREAQEAAGVAIYPGGGAGGEPTDLDGLCLVPTFTDDFDTESISSNGPANGTLWTDHMPYEGGAGSNFANVSGGILNLRCSAPGFGNNLVTTNSAGEGWMQKFGYFEASMKIPCESGTWPAFWLIGNNAAASANGTAEIDIIEAHTAQQNSYMTTLHRDTGGNDSTNNDTVGWGSVWHDLPVNLCQDFHRYGVLWDPDSPDLVFYFDGQPLQSVPKFGTTDEDPMTMIVGCGVGDMIGNNPPGPGAWDAEAQFDYVHAYQIDPTGAACQ